MVFKTRPLAIVDQRADAKHMTNGRKSHPLVIVLHATAGTNSRQWLSRTSVPPVSCHRLIVKDGTIYKIVPDGDTAYTQGFSNMGPYNSMADLDMNDIGLSIEFENLNDGKDPYSNAQVNSGAAQVCEWYGKYGYLPVVSHAMIYGPKTDPLGFPWARFYQVLHGLITTQNN